MIHPSEHPDTLLEMIQRRNRQILLLETLLQQLLRFHPTSESSGERDLLNKVTMELKEWNLFKQTHPDEFRPCYFTP